MTINFKFDIAHFGGLIDNHGHEPHSLEEETEFLGSMGWDNHSDETTTRPEAQGLELVLVQPKG